LGGRLLDREDGEIIVAIPGILPEGDYSNTDYRDIIIRLERIGCIRNNVHEALGSPDPDEDEDEEDLDQDA
jgi:hypothetical protein